MGFENLEDVNWLELWRQRKHLRPEKVDKLLSRPTGWTQKCERMGLKRIPGLELVELTRLYRVSELEFHKAIWAESSRRPR